MAVACDGVVHSKFEGRLKKEAGSEVGDGYGGDRASPDTESREKRDSGNDGEDRMEFEEGGGSAISL